MAPKVVLFEPVASTKARVQAVIRQWSSRDVMQTECILCVSDVPFGLWPLGLCHISLAKNWPQGWLSMTASVPSYLELRIKLNCIQKGESKCLRELKSVRAPQITQGKPSLYSCMVSDSEAPSCPESGRSIQGRVVGASRWRKGSTSHICTAYVHTWHSE